MITVNALAAVLPRATVRGNGATEITDLAFDSRAVRPGALFFCVPGLKADGHGFAEQAVASGASALVVERALPTDVPQIVVPSAREAMAPAAVAFFGAPSRAMTLVGVTGTNGKTTTTFLLESVFRALGWVPGVIGTVEVHIGDVVEPAVRTTPESIELQRLLARMRDAGVRGAAMEVASHGLALHRVAGTTFACAMFTNLTQDHLDFHGTMEEYFEAKAMLFTPAYSERAVVNVDDPYGRRLAERVAIPLTTVSLEGPADVVATSIEMGAHGSVVDAALFGDRVRFRVPLPARYNAANALGVLAAGRALGYPDEQIVAGIESMPGVPGRLERIDAGQDFTVLVDYAHTPDSLDNVLRAAREFTPADARLVVVFGCGGDRDRTKRPLMGSAAAALADRTIITSDNPRSEDPATIIAEIEQGAHETGRLYETIVDRREAIAAALHGAKHGDVVVIAGKGHETGQEFGAGRKIPFDDRIVARELLEDLCSR